MNQNRRIPSAPNASEPGIPHEHLGRVAVEPEGTQAGPDEGQNNDSQFPAIWGRWNEIFTLRTPRCPRCKSAITITDAVISKIRSRGRPFHPSKFHRIGTANNGQHHHNNPGLQAPPPEPVFQEGNLNVGDEGSGRRRRQRYRPIPKAKADPERPA